MIMRLGNFIRAAAIALVIGAMAGCAGQPVKRLVIISTNDIHAAIDNMPYLATLVEAYRSTDSIDNVLLLDAGDRWTGNPYVDMAAEQGMPVIDLMNKLGYDYATLGNHEFDMGVDTLAARVRKMEFCNVLANADFSETAMPTLPPYVVFDEGGLKIAILGLITTATNGHPAGKDESFGESKFFDPIETAKQYTSLRDSADMFIALTHTGIEVDTILAVQMPELDLIVGGHSHTLLPKGVEYGNVLVTQTGSRLRYAGITTVTHKGGKILDMENHLVKLDTIAPAPQYIQMVEQIKESNPTLSQVIGSASADMNKTALLNLFSDIMREGTKSQFAFYNDGSMRLSALPAGEITVGDIFSAEPFKNAPVTMMLTLEDIKTLILNKFNSTGGESHTMDLYPSGMSYTIITDGNGEGTDVIFKHNYGGGADTKYKVAMSDYIDSQYDFPQRGTGTPSGLYITDIARTYISTHSPLKINTDNRVRIVQNS
jgi:5'-nucleotidase